MILDLLSELKIVRKFLKDWDKIHKEAAIDFDDNALQDQCTLKIATLWHYLTPRQKHMVFGGEKNPERIEFLQNIEKYSVEQWEAMLKHLAPFKNIEEYDEFLKSKNV